jgi:siroheme synthase-like protein
MAAAATRPCVCNRALDRCDSSCTADLLDVSFFMPCLDLRDRPCLVIGAGPVGLEKIRGLLAAGGDVTVVAPEAEDEVERLTADGRITWHRRVYAEADLDGQLLVFAATSDTELNVRVYRDAERRSMLVNVVDVPPLCNFIMPAMVRNEPLAIAISTSGASPALAKRLKREIAERYGGPYARLAVLLAGLRGWAKDTLPTYEDRRAFFEDLVNGDPDPVALLAAGDEAGVEALVAERQRAAEAAFAVR